jgi:hypothetical protein
MSKFMTDLFKLLGTQQNPSTAYHPQTDGQTERMNQTLEQYIRVFANYRQDDWKEWLAIAEFSYNDSVHAATQQTPFFLNYGQHPWKGTDTRREVRNESATQFADRMKKVREDAQAALRQSAERMKTAYDKHARPSIAYSKGEKVYLESTNLKTDRPSKKLDDKRFGPFEIIQKKGESSYELKLPEHWPAIHPVFNESYLSPFKKSQYRNQQKPPAPPPIEVEGEQEYNVEEIRDSRKRRGKVQYLVHWEGYPREEDTWEPAENLEHAQELIKDFHDAYPNRPKPITINAINRREEEEDFEKYPKLYNYRHGTQGDGFQKPNPSTNLDVILPISPDRTDCLLQKTPDLLPDLPPETRRVWIYETEPVNAITMIFRLDDNHEPIRKYHLLNPVSERDIKKRYGYAPPLQPRFAPPWLLRDHGRHVQLMSPTSGTETLESLRRWRWQ